MRRRVIHPKPRSRFAAAVTLVLLGGCTNIERSRDWANDKVPGQVLAQQVCSTCHGIEGQSVNTLFPKLAGQQKSYIQSQLEAIRARDRNSDHTRQFMWGPAGNLTNKQIEEVATYFSSKPPMKAGVVQSALSERGKVLYHQGRPSAGVEPCASCHGDSAEGDADVPRLAGQHQYYLVSRARQAMTKIMAPLSDEDIASVAAYLESIGAGGAPAAALKPTGEPVADAANVKDAVIPAAFDSGGDAKNCHYSVWTYGWYCGSFFDALLYHLRNQ